MRDRPFGGPVRRILGISVFLGAVGFGPTHADPVLEVRTDRARYEFGEPVWLYVTVQNPAGRPLAVENPHCSRTVTRLEITGMEGARYPMTGPASCATTVLERIPPGQEMLYAFELLEFYGVDGGQEFPFGFLPPGDYEVRYITHSTTSAPSRFRVEDLDRSDTLAFHAYVRLLAEVRAADLRGATARFRAFVRDYPESPFAVALLCRAGVVSDLFFDSGQAMEDFEKLIRLYPESGFVSVAVRHLAFGMGGDRDKALRFLRGLPDELPGTLAALMAEQTVRRLGLESS